LPESKVFGDRVQGKADALVELRIMQQGRAACSMEQSNG